MAGEVGIDTGRLLLIDPGYVSELPDAGPYAAYGMTVPVAARADVSTYPVRVLRTKDGTIAAVRVDSFPPPVSCPLAGAVPCPHLRRAGARHR